eukprot:scaffold10754_cov20-Prasinocladus_malaysianus.AAC.1
MLLATIYWKALLPGRNFNWLKRYGIGEKRVTPDKISPGRGSQPRTIPFPVYCRGVRSPLPTMSEAFPTDIST